MSDFVFVTTNDQKVRTAKSVCDDFGITFDRQKLELVEIQAENGEPIARHKAEQAYEALKQPVVVSDDSWSFLGLRGFPGPYMKYISEWFTPEDFLRLTDPLQDRRTVLTQILVYQDSHEQKLFSVNIEGEILHELRGNPSFPHFAIVSLDNGRTTIAEADNAGKPAATTKHNAWRELCAWLQDK